MTVGGRLPHEWLALHPELRGLPARPGLGANFRCATATTIVPFGGEIERLVIESDGGAAFVNLAHQFETAFGNQ